MSHCNKKDQTAIYTAQTTFWRSLRRRHDNREQFIEIWCPEAGHLRQISEIRDAVRRQENQDTTYGVPPSQRREASRVAPRVIARRDVVERGRRGGVQQRVQEAERLLPGIEPLVVQQRDDARERRARRARARHRLERPRNVHCEVHALRRHVRVSAASGVEQARVRVPERAQVCLHSRGLVVRAREDIREAARGKLGGRLGGVLLRAAH